MRSALVALCLFAAAAPPAHAEDTFMIDWMAVLIVAGEKCPGHRYDLKGLSAIANENAARLGWTESQLEREAESRTLHQLREYEASPESFCISAGYGRKRLLKELNAARAIK
jgi:hypothetical protein